MKKADKYILLSLTFLLVVSIMGVFIFKVLLAKPGTTAIISQNGSVIHTIDLSRVDEPYEFTIETDHGGFNRVYVEKDRIKFSDADCPDKLCVQNGFLSYTNDIAVCLPHGLLIEIEDGEEGEIDILAH